MRYQHWDVLLFPADSRVPIQEFDTKCFALDSNTGNHDLHRAADLEVVSFESMALVPTMTCFVATLDRRAPFRVSIHSWKKPIASKILQSYKMKDEKVMFEVRIYIDGILKVQHLLESDSAWPEVMEEERLPGGSRALLFPAFQTDVLHQSHWEPGDVLGRIRVIVAEGVVREHHSREFDRLRDVVVFSFQHAPQDILEYSGIAWPNMRMFGKSVKQATRSASIGTRLPPSASTMDLHAHSPERLPVSNRNGKELSSGTERFQRLLNAETFSDLQSDPPIKVVDSYPDKLESSHHSGVMEIADDGDDPFTGPKPIASRAWRAQLRVSSHDVSMPDYASSRTGHSRTRTEMSGISYPKSNFLKHMEEANPREIVQALSPAQQAQLMKELKALETPGQGTHAPSNTPRSLTRQIEPPLPIDRVRDGLSTRVRSNSNHNQERRFADVVDAPRTATGADGSTTSSASRNSGGGEVLSLARAGEGRYSGIIGANRPRSHSNLSKRKWCPNSPVGTGINTEGRVHATVDSSPSEAGHRIQGYESSATEGGIATEP